MTSRTIYTCDKCHTEHDSGQKGDFPIECGWSMTTRLGVVRFCLCKPCTAEMTAFLGLPEYLQGKTDPAGKVLAELSGLKPDYVCWNCKAEVYFQREPGPCPQCGETEPKDSHVG